MLEFEYCECGCKGSLSMEIGGISFWIPNTLKGPVSLHRGHGWVSPKIKDCTSYEEAVQVATEEARVLLNKEQSNLDEIRRQVNATKLDDVPLWARLIDKSTGTPEEQVIDLERRLEAMSIASGRMSKLSKETIDRNIGLSSENESLKNKIRDLELQSSRK